MRALGTGVVAVALLGGVVLVAAGCGGRRIDNGVFYSTQGYRVRIPGPEWTVVDDSRADLQLKARDGKAGMLAHATCEAHTARRPVSVLQRQLLIGLRDRRVVERSEVTVGRLPGTRSVVEATADDDSRVRIETVTATDGRCVYDLIYAASLDVFPERRAAFDDFVGSFLLAR